jgi:imidazolonepropionase
MKGDLFIVNIGQIATASGKKALRGPDMGRLLVTQNGAILVEKGIISYAGVQEGPDYEAALKKARAGAYPLLDAAGKACVPVFVDCHSHFLFAGFQAENFSGAPHGLVLYGNPSPGRRHGKTAKATREAFPSSNLLSSGGARLRPCSPRGSPPWKANPATAWTVTTELRQLQAMAALDAMQPVDIVPDLYGRHSLPPEFREDRGVYRPLS